MKKIIVILGPTASGKSELAVWLAKKINGEIISADSRQIYRGLDIGTAKVPRDKNPKSEIRNPKQIPKTKFQTLKNLFYYKKIRHHLLDIANPKKVFTVAQYQKLAQKAIQDITKRGKIPILCGGTGFWIDAVVYDLKLPEVPPNPKLREKFGKKTASELLKILKKLDPARAETIEQKNPRRLIRAIEIAKAIGKVPQIKKQSPYQTLWLGLKPPKKTLEQKIKNRTNQMLKSGLIRETKKLLKTVSRKRIKEFGFEYKNTLDYIDGKISKEELIETLNKNTLEYARRQMVWFKRNKEIRWVNGQQVLKLALNFITQQFRRSI